MHLYDCRVIDKKRANEILDSGDVVNAMNYNEFAEVVSYWGSQHTPLFKTFIEVLKYFAKGAVDKERYDQDMEIGWARYENTDADDAEDWPLDLDAGGAPDGTYEVEYTHLDGPGRASGVIVKDGKFVEEPTLIACATARNAAEYHGYFLEDLTFNKKRNLFIAAFGS